MALAARPGYGLVPIEDQNAPPVQIAVDEGQQEAVEVIAARVGPGGQAGLRFYIYRGFQMSLHSSYYIQYLLYLNIMYNTFYIYIYTSYIVYLLYTYCIYIHTYINGIMNDFEWVECGSAG